MQSFKSTFLFLGFLAFFCSIGCQHKKPNPPELISIDLLRGDITLCGDPEFGEVKFSLSCDYSVRETFDLAVSLLHSFEYKEAEKAFVQVIDVDPDCAMAYWGVAMSMYHALWFAPSEDDLKKGSELLQIAESLQKSDREQEYLQAVGAFYEGWDEIVHQERAARMEHKMEEIYKKYPDDTEAAIFYALALRSTADINDLEYTNQKKAGKILEQIFPNQPNHPGIAHYIIHNYDYPELASMALSTARRYADIAPASAHAQHMPSHIFTRLGLWDESIQSNLRSASAAQCYAEQTEMDGHWDEEVHAMDYLVYAYLQQGDNKRANEQYQYLQTMEKLISLTGPYNFGAIPVRIALENKQWNQAAKMSLHASDVQWEQWQWEIALVHFARALGASHTGDLKSAENEIVILKSLQQKLIDAGEDYKADQVFIQIKASQAWLNFAKGDNEQAVVLMREASDMEESTEKHPKTPCEVLPASELLGDMLLAMNEYAEALKAYEIDLKGHPNRFNGIYGAAIASKSVGDDVKATLYFNMLLALTEMSNSDRPEVEEAREFIRQKES